MRSGNIPPELLKQLGFNPQFLKKQRVSAIELSTLMEAILEKYVNNGYPFASISLDSIELNDREVSAAIVSERNKLVRFDSILLNEGIQLSPKYISNFLGIKKGALFDQSKVDAIPAKIRALPFARQGEMTVNFKGNKAIIFLELIPEKKSRFDLLIGILPSNDNKVRITGDVNASLYNILGQGEYFGFHYKSLQEQQQELELKIDYPYLLNIPFGINSLFELFRNGDISRDIKFNLGMNYKYSNNINLGIFWDHQSSRLLSVDSDKLINSRKLPKNLDVRLNGIGISLNYSKLDYPFNPSSGIFVSLEGSGGQKSVLPNIEIQAIKNDLVDFTDSYDTINDGYQFSIKSHIDYYIPLGQLFTLKLSNQSAIKLSEHELYQNELFRIGGSQLLRGFNEESLFSRTHAVFSSELRLIIARNSYFFVFADYAFIESRIEEQFFWDRPYGFGTGLSFDTGAGILLVSAAVGSQMNSPPDFSSSKIHVGYISLF